MIWYLDFSAAEHFAAITSPFLGDWQIEGSGAEIIKQDTH